MLIAGDACAEDGFRSVNETMNVSDAEVPFATVSTSDPVPWVHEPVESDPLPSKNTLEFEPVKGKPVDAVAVCVVVSPEIVTVDPAVMSALTLNVTETVLSRLAIGEVWPTLDVSKTTTCVKSTADAYPTPSKVWLVVVIAVAEMYPK